MRLSLVVLILIILASEYIMPLRLLFEGNLYEGNLDKGLYMGIRLLVLLSSYLLAMYYGLSMWRKRRMVEFFVTIIFVILYPILFFYVVEWFIGPIVYWTLMVISSWMRKHDVDNA